MFVFCYFTVSPSARVFRGTRCPPAFLRQIQVDAVRREVGEAVLYIAARTDGDAVHIAAQHGARPHGNIFGKRHFADDDARFVYHTAFVDFGRAVLESSDCVHFSSFGKVYIVKGFIKHSL